VYLGNPPPEDRLYDDYYRASRPDPAGYRADAADPHLRELHAINVQRVARVRALAPSGRLLDVGCGRGHFLLTARAAGYEVSGVDVSEGAVGYARKHFGLNADTRTLRDVAETGARFDVVTLWHVLEHFVDPMQALESVGRVLAPGGLLVVEVPNLHSLKFVLAGKKWVGGNHPLYHRTFFTAQTLRLMLVRAGFVGARRMRWSYAVPGRSPAYERVKRALDLAGMDAFLDFTARSAPA
jgi:SAM-dependent methyltransferase